MFIENMAPMKLFHKFIFSTDHIGDMFFRRRDRRFAPITAAAIYQIN
jgi:hypothetical protein